MLPLRDHVGLSPQARQQIEAATANHQILDRVVKWGLHSDPPRVVSNVVAQDEYTHDVVMRWSDELVLVYDCS